MRYFLNTCPHRVEPVIPDQGRTLRLGAGQGYATTDARKITALTSLPGVIAEINQATYDALPAWAKLPVSGETEPGVVVGASAADLADAVATEVSARDAKVAAEATARDAAIISAFDATENEQGIGTMLKGFVGVGMFWRIRTEQQAGWSAASNVSRLDAAGWFKTSWTAAKTNFSTPTLDTWFQNTSGQVVYFAFTIGIIELGGQNEHVYLEEATGISPVTGLNRVDFAALRTGAHTS